MKGYLAVTIRTISDEINGIYLCEELDKCEGGRVLGGDIFLPLVLPLYGRLNAPVYMNIIEKQLVPYLRAYSITWSTLC